MARPRTARSPTSHAEITGAQPGGPPWRSTAATHSQITKAIARLTRVDLVIVDDIGMLPVGADAAEGFYRLVDAAYEHRSLAVSSNLHPSGFDELMPKTLATATVDRLLHHAHICLTEGDSFRLSEATAGKGVKPLPS
jgi:DNA replication protein DnaC